MDLIRQRLLETINRMWLCFSSVATVEDKESIEKFLEAKEEAHNLILKMGNKNQKNIQKNDFSS